MRPHRLTLTAFGPFAGTAAVDFEPLADAGLFLLHGDTGAGKTTLLDGICYALFGTVPGQRAAANRLRSDHADPATASEVVLDTTIGGQRLRISRKPAWQRPKKRGSGTTEEKASVQLERMSANGWEMVSTRGDEVGRAIGDAIGMTSEQFLQVVLLPQGGFATFLQAKVEERAALLQKLFGTERFKDVERWLQDQRRTGERALSQGTHALDEAAAAIAQAAGIGTQELDGTEPDRTGPDSPGPDRIPGERDALARDPVWAEALLRTAEEELAAATRSSSVAGELLAAATKHRDEVGNLLARARARAAASAELTMLAEQDEELARIAAEVAAARRAAPVLPHLAAAADGAVHVDRTAAQEQQARIRLAELAPELAEAEPAALLAAHDAAQQRVGGLEALRPLAEEITQLRQAAADAGSASGTAKAALAENEAARTTLPTRVLDARAVVDTARTAAAQVEGMQLRAQSLTRALATAGTRDELDATRATLHEQVVAAREHAQEARQLYQDLQQRQLDGAAARLASLLAPGEPCPVCGGVEHPVPAEPLVDAVSTEQVERAETAYQAAGAALQELERQLSAADARRIEQAGQLTDFGGAEVATTVLREQLTEAKSAALQAIERADGLQMAEDALAELERERGELDTRRARLEAELTSLTDRTAETSAAVARAEARLAKHLDGAADLDAAIMAAQQRAQAIADARGAARAAIEAVDTRVRLDQDAHAAATAAGFLGVAQVQAAVRDPSWIEQQEAARRAHDAAVTAARTRLIDSGEDPLDATALADAVAAATGAVEESARAHRAAVAAQGARAQQAGDLQRLVPRYCAAWTRLQPQRQACEQLKALADLTAGDGANHRRMALSSYVLAARLEQVAAAASVRLLRMTDGRYALLHSDDAVGAQRRRGLALRVSDSWTGQDRDTASLSGGETFLASLALALGLADVVTAEAGGARIETLFVDEGFGTLDEDTLDEVLGVLDGLREGGRMVGVVSHVAELRQRVPTRIEVRKTRSGSTIHQPQPATV